MMRVIRLLSAALVVATTGVCECEPEEEELPEDQESSLSLTLVADQSQGSAGDTFLVRAQLDGEGTSISGVPLRLVCQPAPEEGRWSYGAGPTTSARVDSDAEGRAEWVFGTRESGSYTLTASSEGAHSAQGSAQVTVVDATDVARQNTLFANGDTEGEWTWLRDAGHADFLSWTFDFITPQEPTFKVKLEVWVTDQLGGGDGHSTTARLDVNGEELEVYLLNLTSPIREAHEGDGYLAIASVEVPATVITAERVTVTLSRINGQEAHIAGRGSSAWLDLVHQPEETVCERGIEQVSADITTDTAWRSCLYTIERDITVASGSTLALGPGVTVKLGAGVDLRLESGALLVVAGTAEDPVTFTSLHDDSVAGDSDGAGPPPARGDWGSLVLEGSAGLRASHARLRYGSPALRGDGAGYSVNLSQVIFEQNALHGAQLAGVAHDSTITDCAFNDNDAALQMDGAVDLGASNSFSGNGIQAIELTAFTGVEQETDHWWIETEVPFVIDSLEEYLIPAGHSLTLAANVVVKLAGGGIGLAGALEAAGTSANQVVFTSLKDDSVGGDTNGDGDASVPAPGDWGGVHIYQGAELLADATRLSFAQDAIWETAGDGFLLQLDGVTITDSAGYAIQMTGAHSESNVDSCVFERNQRPLLVNGAFALGGGNTFGATPETANTENGVFVAMFEPASGTTEHTWSETDVPFVVAQPEGLTIPSGHGLSLSQDVVLKLEQNSLILVGEDPASGSPGATLSATTGAVITSIHDDAAGGDTDAGGLTPAPAPGDWGSIVLGDGASLSLTNCDIRYAAAAILGQGDAVSLRLVTSTLADNAGFALDAPSIAYGSAVSGCSFERNAAPLRVDGSFGLGSSNMFADNARDGIFLSGFHPASSTNLHTWTETDVPFILTASDPVVVPPLNTLAIQPGVVVKLEDQSFELAAGSATPSVAGAKLIANGEVDNRITFTSLADDSVGGDSNGDGAASTPAPGDWGHLGGGARADLRLTNVDVRYGEDAITNPDGGALMSISLSQCDIGHNAGDGVDLSAANPTGLNRIADCHFHDNAEYGVNLHDATTRGLVDVSTGNTFSANGSGEINPP